LTGNMEHGYLPVHDQGRRGDALRRSTAPHSGGFKFGRAAYIAANVRRRRRTADGTAPAYFFPVADGAAFVANANRPNTLKVKIRTCMRCFTLAASADG